ncbi:MAG TPA: acyltransferase [Deltaproteobacteria bacterium]|nr:acyltransferase [Deltaproteobacteria bacterium]
MRRLVLRVAIALLAPFSRAMTPLASGMARIWHRARLKASLTDVDVSVQCDGCVIIGGTRDIRIGKRCRLGRDIELSTEGEGRIRLGDEVRINRGCTLVSYTGITIGDYTIIGEYVSIRDANHGTNKDEPMRYQEHTAFPIHIGRDVWIGRGCCILPGTTIGEGSVIGANSVVTSDIPPYSIAAGSPARVVKKRK